MPREERELRIVEPALVRDRELDGQVILHAGDPDRRAALIERVAGVKRMAAAEPLRSNVPPFMLIVVTSLPLRRAL